MTENIVEQNHGDDIQEMYRRARKAFKEIEFWTQEKVDEMVMAAGWEWQKEDVAKKLARLAVDESKGIGVYEDKLHKIQAKTRGTMRDLTGQKTCGLVRIDKEKGLSKSA
jgi:sulfoacetaldehyde dehydrogenase